MPAGAQAASVASSALKLKVDQSNNTTDGLSLCNGLWGQTFVPRAKNLARVDLRLTINNLTEQTPTTAALHTLITGTPIATTTTLVAPHAPGELSRTVAYSFDPPIHLTKDTTYTLAFMAPPDACWEFTFIDPYPSGDAVLSDGTPLNPAADFVFATYELK